MVMWFFFFLLNCSFDPNLWGFFFVINKRTERVTEELKLKLMHQVIAVFTQRMIWLFQHKRVWQGCLLIPNTTICCLMDIYTQTCQYVSDYLLSLESLMEFKELDDDKPSVKLSWMRKSVIKMSHYCLKQWSNFWSENIEILFVFSFSFICLFVFFNFSLFVSSFFPSLHYIFCIC